MTKQLDYGQKAREIFITLICDPAQGGMCESEKTIFGTNADYWKLGCVFDTLLDYMLMAVNDRTITPSVAQDVVSRVLAKYGQVYPCWYDDFAWWGVLGCKAFDPAYDEVFGANKDAFKQIALSCWDVIQNGKPTVPESKGAPNAYASCDQVTFASVAPKFPGGVWQYDIWACPRTDEDRCFGLTESNSPIAVPAGPCIVSQPKELGPYQQSVMTGLYLLLSQRLADYNQTGPSFANNIYSFIDNWVNHPSLTAAQTLMNTFDRQDEGIIRERVSIYANGDAVNLYNQGDAAWAGDQGLVLGGLLNYYLANPEGKNEALNMALKIVRGTFNKMSNHGDSHGIVNYWYPVNNDNPIAPFLGDPGDYSSGLGVFFRYLLFGFTNNAEIRNEIQSNEAILFKIKRTADAAYDDKLPMVTGMNPVFNQFNRLSVLTFAIQMLKVDDKKEKHNQKDKHQ